MNTDIRIAVSFKGHRKRKKLELLLGPKAVLALIDLWISSAMNHPDGKLVAMDELDIALEAGWEGDAEEFVGALVGVKFLDKTEDGTYELHDWPEHQHWVIGAKERSVRARKAAEARWANRYSEQSGERARSMLAASPEHIDRNAPFLSYPKERS